jgi:hypothetical protein
MARPSQVLRSGRGYDMEIERLAAALLRALNVPSRPALAGARTLCQWWVQPGVGNGFWTNMDVSGACGAVRKPKEKVEPQMPAVPDDAITNYGVDGRGALAFDWAGADGALWLSIPPQFVKSGTGEKGTEAAKRAVELFGKTGMMQDQRPLEAEIGKPGEVGVYAVTSGAVLRISSLGAGRKFTVRFPTGVSNDYRAPLSTTYWTDHPEWVRAVRREVELNETSRESMQWLCIDFELGVRASASTAAAQDDAK